MIAYHFLRANMTTLASARKRHWYHISRRETPWAVGEERTVKQNVVLGKRGYHSSPSWWGALKSSQSIDVPRDASVACVVEVTKPMGADETYQVSATRKLLAAKNVESDLRLFACDIGEEA